MPAVCVCDGGGVGQHVHGLLAAAAFSHQAVHCKDTSACADVGSMCVCVYVRGKAYVNMYMVHGCCCCLPSPSCTLQAQQ